MLKATVREVLDKSQTPEVVMPARSAQSTTVKGRLSPFRAQRFNLHLPLKYRQVGENSWRAGTTENISRSGLLFRAQELMSPNAQVEINLVLPPEIAGLASAEVICRGEVVRSVAAESPAMSPALGARILQYHFHHSGARIGQA